jgi:hypothetical protein
MDQVAIITMLLDLVEDILVVILLIVALTLLIRNGAIYLTLR